MNTPIKELLTLLKEEFENTFEYIGLCMAINDLLILDKITPIQYSRLREYLYANRPKDYKFETYKGWYWDKKDKQSRINWLNEHINL